MSFYLYVMNSFLRAVVPGAKKPHVEGRTYSPFGCCISPLPTSQKFFWTCGDPAGSKKPLAVGSGQAATWGVS